MVKEFSVNGSSISLRFGVRALSMFEKAKGVPISKALTDLESIESQIEFCYCAAKDFEITNGKESTVTKDDIINLYEQEGFETIALTIGEGVQQYFTKKNTTQTEEITQ